MQQVNKVSTLEVVALRRFVSEAEKRHTMIGAVPKILFYHQLYSPCFTELTETAGEKSAKNQRTQSLK